MTDPLIYACLEELRDKMLVTKSEAGVTIVEKAIEEIQRLNKDYAYAVEEINRLNKVVESQNKTILHLSEGLNNRIGKYWEVTPKPARPVEYGDDHL